jgi:hypothetical protein
MTMFVVGASRGEVLLNERYASEGGMVGINASIENRDDDSIAGKRRSNGTDSVDAPSRRSGGQLCLAVPGNRLDQFHRH